MSLLDRSKARIETDLDDGELLAAIEAIQAEIDRRFGAVGAPVTVEIDGGGRSLTLWRPIDAAQALTVVEVEADEVSETTLDPADYRRRHGGRTLERLLSGPNGRRVWAPLVRVTYTPVSDERRRDEVILATLALDLSYRGLAKQERAGDHSRAGPQTFDAYTREREALLAQLAPRRGLAMA